MNKLSVNQLSEINGGSEYLGTAAAVSCVLAFGMLGVGTLIFGPSCVGTAIAWAVQ